LKEGPYVVVDDAALSHYKNDPRVHLIPGHPMLRDGMPQLFKGPGGVAPRQRHHEMQQFQRWGMHNLAYGTSWRKAATVARPAAVLLALACAAAL
jgi:hypothetical protein